MNETQKSIIEKADHLLRSNGYSAVNLQTIALELGIKKASIFYYYPSKDALIIDVIKRFSFRFEKWKLLHSNKSPEEQFFLFTQSYKELSDHARKACPLGQISSDIHRLDQGIQIAFHELYQSLKSYLIFILPQLQKFQNISSHHSEMFSVFILSALSGALKIAKIEGNLDALESSIQTLLTFFIQQAENEVITF